MPATNVPSGAQDAARARGVVRRLLPTLAMVVVVALCIAAGNWQRGRMLQKEALGAGLAAAAAAPVDPLPAGGDDWAARRFRQVGLAGRYDEARQSLIGSQGRADGSRPKAQGNLPHPEARATGNCNPPTDAQ